MVWLDYLWGMEDVFVDYPLLWVEEMGNVDIRINLVICKILSLLEELIHLLSYLIFYFILLR